MTKTRSLELLDLVAAVHVTKPITTALVYYTDLGLRYGADVHSDAWAVLIDKAVAYIDFNATPEFDPNLVVDYARSTSNYNELEASYYTEYLTQYAEVFQ